MTAIQRSKTSFERVSAKCLHAFDQSVVVCASTFTPPLKSKNLVFLYRRRRAKITTSADVQKRNTKHTTVQNDINDSTLTKFQTLMTFLTVRVSASYKNFDLVTRALLTRYQQPRCARPCACTFATLGESKKRTREKVQLF